MSQNRAAVQAAWRTALESDAALLCEVAALDNIDALEAAEIDASAVDEGVLAGSAVIDALRERLGAVRKAIDDLPRRRQARDDAEHQLDDLARRLGLGSHDVLLQRLPTDAALASARDAIAQLNRASQALIEAETRQARAQREHDAFAAEDGPHQEVLDVEHIRQRFDALGDIPAQADRHRRDTAALTNEIQGLEAAVAAIDPAPGALDRLRALPLPDTATIAKFVHATEVAESETKRLGDGLAATEEALAATEAELARLRGSGGGVPSRSDLTGARQLRDAELDALGAVLDTDATARKLRFAEVKQSSKAIDVITDILLTDTQRATHHRHVVDLARSVSRRPNSASPTAQTLRISRLSSRNDALSQSDKDEFYKSTISINCSFNCVQQSQAACRAPIQEGRIRQSE